MMAIQNTTGSQYLMKFRLKVIVALTPFGWALPNNLRYWRRYEGLYHMSECFCAKDGLIKQILRPELVELFQWLLPILYNGGGILTILNGL